MLISIKTLAQRKITIDFEPYQKIIDIKETLQEKEGIQKEMIRLIFQGKLMNDDDKIEDYKIEPGSFLMMALNLKGGI